MNALVTGASGFAGKHLCRHLLSLGIQVHGLTRKPLPTHGVVVHQSDILDRENLKLVVEKSRPDYIFHLAAISSVRKSFQEPDLTRKTNVDGTRNILDAASEKAKNAKILLVSTSEVYGEQERMPITEKQEPDPLNPYAESKLEMERLCESYEVDYIIARSFTHTGPGQSQTFFCSEFAKAIAEIEKDIRKPVLTYGDEKIVRDLTDVRDVVQAYLLLLEHGKNREIYNVCSGKGLSIREIMSILTGLSSKTIETRQDTSKAGRSIRTMIG
ncbi:MAG: GDP-mannose 4,6-dehydratase, partial [Candidatus Woesearchaeota archaeon]